jgi:hypothetical protein
MVMVVNPRSPGRKKKLVERDEHHEQRKAGYDFGHDQWRDTNK